MIELRVGPLIRSSRRKEALTFGPGKSEPPYIGCYRFYALFVSAFCFLFAQKTPAAPNQAPLLHFTPLAAIPDGEGFAGTYAGVSHGVLIVAGGANFPGKRPWEGGTKVWSDSIFVLENPEGTWRAGFTLPRAAGYGVSITTPKGIACIGGGNLNQHFKECFLLAWDGHGIKTKALPDLPLRCAFMTGALLGNTIYIAGGIEEPASTKALHTFWTLDLSSSHPRWQELAPWPGPERILATAGTDRGAFFLFSGAQLKADVAGKPVRTWLRDAYCYTPGQGWKRIADLPRPAVAAASPAPMADGSTLALLGGDDGTQLNFKPETAHPGFPRDLLLYNIGADRWQRGGDLPFSRATVSAVDWRGHIVIPNGEVRPGYRTPEVWWGKFQ